MFIFLMCSERSGSNFITKLMNGHSKIVGPSTKHLFNPLLRNYFRYGDLTVSENWDGLLVDILRLFQSDFSIWETKLDLEKLRNMCPPGDLTALLRAIFQAEARVHGKEHVFVKENHVYEFFPYLMTYFPDAKFVYQVRDPRDMALSWKINENVRGGVVSSARQWKKDQQNSLKNAAILDTTQKVYTLRYEDLIEQPAKHAEEICNFLGLAYEKGILLFYQDSLTIKNSEQISAWSNLAKAVIKNNKNKYKGVLSEEEIKSIEKICYFEMLHFGYQAEYSHEKLAAWSDEEVENLHQIELAELKYEPVHGVLANMSAKARFYRR